jgi:hypothetical protein
MRNHDIGYQKAKQSFDDSDYDWLGAGMFACSLIGVLGFILLVLPS